MYLPVVVSELVSINAILRTYLPSQAPFLTPSPPVMHLTRVLKPSAQANGTEICLVLQPPCPTLYDLCPSGKCPYAIFNNRGSKNLCCPVNYMNSDVLS